MNDIIAKYNKLRDADAETASQLQHMVVMSISGIEVPSSSVFAGTLYNCQQTVARMNKRDKHTAVCWIVVPCCN